MLTLIWRSWRSWGREKGVALLAAFALAIGIGSTTAIFTVVDSVLLKPVSYSFAERWIALLGGNTLDPNHFSGISYSDCRAYQERVRSFEVFGCYSVGGDFNLTSPGQPRHIDGIEVSPDLIANTGALPVAGHFFTTADGPNTVVISYRMFKLLGAGVIGHAITLNGQPYVVAAAMPAEFRLPIVTVYGQNSQNDVWIPLNKPVDENHARNYAFYTAYARLRPEVSFSQAKAEALGVAAQLRTESHPTDPTYTAAFFGLHEIAVKTIRPILLLLFGAAVLLLLITCANVAGLLVSRSVGRARETAIRVALGGSQGPLAIQYFLESLWVSLAASIGGVLASIILVRILVSLAANYIPRSNEVSTDWTVVFFALVLGFLTATLSSLAPLWQAFRTPPNDVLSNGLRASAGLRSKRLSQALVIGELAMAFTLISAGAILLWQFRVLVNTSPGFDPKEVLTFQLTRSAQAGNAGHAAGYTDRLVEALETIPGVINAAAANQLPLAGCCFSTAFFPEGSTSGRQPNESVSLMEVSTSYFKTFGIPLLAGRLLNTQDTNENLLAVVIDQALATQYWPKRSAIGELAHLGGADGTPVQIVGIVGTTSNNGLGKKPMPEVYLSNKVAQMDTTTFIVRSTLTPNALTNAVRRSITRLDPAQPIYAVRTMAEIFDDSLILQRIEGIVVSFFALAALLMACLGIYGLTSYSVRQRTTEMGTRMAVGATGGELLRLIAGDGLRLAVYGILAGTVTTVIATQLVRSYLEVHQLGPAPYVFSMFTVLGLAVLASLVPAWRASLLSPVAAIRNDSDSIWNSARRRHAEARERTAEERETASLDTTLLNDFIDASRRANSFAEVLQAALLDLGNQIHSKSALLLESISPGEFQCAAATRETAFTLIAIPESGFLLNRLRFYGSPMSFTAADLETCHRWAVNEKPQQVGELEQLQSMGLRLAAPLRTRTNLIGLLLFGRREGERDYNLPEKNLVAACAEQFALTIENSRLNNRLLEQEKVRRDIALATEVQRRLLPENPPQTAATSFGAFTLAARSVGGDYYDFLQLGEHTIGIALADVAGKGIAAALIMAVVQASLRIIAAEDKVSLPGLAAKLNKFVHRSTGFSSYATFFYAQLDEEKRQLRYVNAGHNPPYLVRASQESPIEELATGGMIVGMFPAASYEEAVVDLNLGDVLLAFTDGVTEALNGAEQEYGEDRLKELVRRVAHLPIAEITSSISQTLREWIGEAPQHDDLTFIVMKVTD